MSRYASGEWIAKQVANQMDVEGSTIGVVADDHPALRWMIFASGDPGDPEANARLMAAAKDTAEALRDLKAVVIDHLLPKVSGEGWLADQVAAQSVFRQVGEALTKAGVQIEAELAGGGSDG